MTWELCLLCEERTLFVFIFFLHFRVFIPQEEKLQTIYLVSIPRLLLTLPSNYNNSFYFIWIKSFFIIFVNPLGDLLWPWNSRNPNVCSNTAQVMFARQSLEGKSSYLKCLMIKFKSRIAKKSFIDVIVIYHHISYRGLNQWVWLMFQKRKSKRSNYSSYR